MKKIFALLLTLALLLSAAAAEEVTGTGKYNTLTVGVTTPFSGNFFSAVLGNNTSDLDVRRLIHGYSLVEWHREQTMYQFDSRVVSGAVVGDDGKTYNLVLSDRLSWQDGSPITAEDYAFSILLLTSKELEEAAGARADGSRFNGWEAYSSGESKGLAGVQMHGANNLKFTYADGFLPYFYELEALNFTPLPISVIAPGCRVADDGNGVYIDGPFTADLLRKTLLDPETGYVTHPELTCGPYSLVSFDGDTATLRLNGHYLGDENGVMPQIPEIVVRETPSNEAVNALSAGEIDLLVRCLREDQITNGMALAGTGAFSMANYVRNGLSMISFRAEEGPTGEKAVRQAVASCLDRENLIRTYTAGFGIQVDGYYGLGQWMYLMANGTILPQEDDGRAAEWEALNLEGLTRYTLDVEKAKTLLRDAGWTLNEDGSAYDETAEAPAVRCREKDGKQEALRLKLIYPVGNEAGPLLNEYFVPYLAQAGIALETEAIPMEELLEQYYGKAPRTSDMILLGTNFAEVFDPYPDFSADGTNRLNGVQDWRLMKLAEDMRQTEPGDVLTYCRKWLSFQEARTSVAMEIPLYSNAYFDFFIPELQNYAPATNASWTDAILNAFLGDVIEAPAEETEEDMGDDDWDF